MILSKTVSRFLIGNFGGQKAVGWYIQMLKEKILSTNNLMSGKTALKSKAEIKTFPGQKQRSSLPIYMYVHTRLFICLHSKND